MYNWRNLDRNPSNRYCRGTWRVAESITQAVEQIRSIVLTTNPDESATKQGVVLRMLGLCGWNLFDLSQVAPGFTVGSRRVDYALMPGSANVVFIEVKRLGENLANHQQQLLEYCFQEGVRLAVVTSGQTWWLYLPLQPGSWAERRFLTIDLASQDSAIVEQGLMEYLSRENVGNGRAVSEAEDLVRSRQRAEIVDRTIVEAWNQIVATPDELLVDLVSEVTERICGIAPGRELVEQFLSRRVPAMVFLAEESSLWRHREQGTMCQSIPRALKGVGQPFQLLWTRPTARTSSKPCCSKRKRGLKSYTPTARGEFTAGTPRE